MSWDNVINVNAFSIWTEISSSDSQKNGHLFVNGRHQIKVTIGINFDLTDSTLPGPTEDEVYTAISLVDDIDGNPLKYLNPGEPGNYTAIYDPALGSKSTSYPDVNTSEFQYELAYYLSSSETTNPDCDSEKVSAIIEYTINGDKHTNDFTTNSTGDIKDSITVSCYPEKKYGTASSTTTPIVASFQDTNPTVNIYDVKDTHDHDDYNVFSVFIDDDYFKIHDIDSTVEPNTNLVPACYIQKDYDTPMWDAIYNVCYPAFIPSEKTYTVTTKLYNSPDHVIYTVDVTVHAHANEVIFITCKSNVKSNKHYTHVDNNQHLSIHDQFGNHSMVDVVNSRSSIDIGSVS